MTEASANRIRTADRAAKPAKLPAAAPEPATANAAASESRIGRQLTGSPAIGFLVSILLHGVVLMILAVLILPDALEFARLDLLTILDKEESTKLGIDVDLPDSAKISFKEAGGGEERRLPKIVPSEYVAPPSESGTLPTELVKSIQKLVPDGSGEGNSEGDGDADDGRIGAPAGGANPGSNAVTAGPFTVWSYPNPPLPREPYYVFIRVKVPEKAKKRYAATDLSGVIKGNDSKFGGVQDYTQRIPFEPNLTTGPDPGYRRHAFRMDTRRKNFVPLDQRARNKFLPVVDGYATLAVKVPGAEFARVEAEIVVASKLLDEKKTLQLVFANPDDNDPEKKPAGRKQPNGKQRRKPGAKPATPPSVPPNAPAPPAGP